MNTLIFQKSYKIYVTLSKTISKWPKLSRYSLGLRLENSCINLLEEVITSEQIVSVLKDKVLLKASVKNEMIKVLLRLAMEQKLIKETVYFAIAQDLLEIGKMIGGWRKSLIK